MSNIASSPVVVVTEERKRRRGLLWLAAGAAVVLTSGSTFALWSANDTFTGGTITAGDLNLVQTADTSFWDVSGDRTDETTTVPGTDGSQQGHTITPATWRSVPGDKVAAAFSADVTLEGDNLVGKLSVSGIAEADGNPSMTWSYEVYHDDALLVSETALPSDATLAYISAPGTGQADGGEDGSSTVLSQADKTEDYTVVLYGTFTDVADRTDVTNADELSDVSLNLDQVRDTGALFG
jgi:alternate signal-mediated exported protein